MAQRSYFFDSVAGDRVYNTSDMSRVLARLVGRDGVVYGYEGELKVSPTSPEGMSVAVAIGAAFVQGRLFEAYDLPETLAIAPADPTNPRIDRVVVRLDNSSAVRSVSLAVRAGTPAASPVPPTLQRDGTVWELSLAQVRVNAGVTSIASANITDERANATLCGNAFGFLSPSTGHKHTDAPGDGPQIDPSAFDTANWPAFRAYQSAAQSLAAATWTKVAYQTEVYDQGNVYDNTAYEFIAPAAGIYLVGAWIAFTGTSDNRILELYVNGTSHSRIVHEVGTMGGSAIGGVMHLKLAAGDKLSVMVYSSAAQNTAAVSTLSYFTAVRIA